MGARPQIATTAGSFAGDHSVIVRRARSSTYKAARGNGNAVVGIERFAAVDPPCTRNDNADTIRRIDRDAGSYGSCSFPGLACGMKIENTADFILCDLSLIDTTESGHAYS
jgi:hypothetical protein